MHKTIGIIGGLSPESTVEYYEHITRSYTERFGDFGYPQVVIYSVCFQTYVDWCNQERWSDVAQGLSLAAQRLVAAGADFLVIAANTMHIVLDQVQASVNVPVLSLLDALSDAIHAHGMHSVGLLGTRFTMEKPFYRDALADRGISVLVPDSADRDDINRVIYDELVAGRICDESRALYVSIIDKLAAQGAEGIVLGCTEIPLLVRERDVAIPLFNTTTLHAEAALNYALGESVDCVVS
jgi:aspartate racemase